MGFGPCVRLDERGSTVIELLAAVLDEDVLPERRASIIVAALILCIVGRKQTVVAVGRAISAPGATRRKNRHADEH